MSSSRPPDLARRCERIYPADRTEDQRGDFQRDRDRILYTSAFRRLADVTQVVQAVEGPVFHNRLTHSLKVAQIGRRLAEYLLQREKAGLVDAVGGIDPDVVEAACLAHDLGHPPFGHIAEAELDRCLRERGISDGFEGNAQSFRIVTRVAIRHHKSPGLNLTLATLNAILKYPWGRKTGGDEERKWGFYHDEEADFDRAREILSGARNDKRRSTEAELMDWADDVTYAVHDVDDFYRAGLIPLDRLLDAATEERAYFHQTFTALELQRGQVPKLTLNQVNELFDGLVKIQAIPRPGLFRPFMGTRDQRAGLDFLSALLIKRYVVGVGELKKPEEPALTVNAEDPKLPRISIDSRFRAEVDLLKGLAKVYVFSAPALVAQQYGQRDVVAALFDAFYDACDSEVDIGIIPEPFRSDLEGLAKSGRRERKRQRARLVADMIASMTERQALLMHARLTGRSSGSIRDVILY